MKAKPVKFVYGVGYFDCEKEDATHVTLNMPSPTGKHCVAGWVGVALKL